MKGSKKRLRSSKNSTSSQKEQIKDDNEKAEVIQVKEEQPQFQGNQPSQKKAGPKKGQVWDYFQQKQYEKKQFFVCLLCRKDKKQKRISKNKNSITYIKKHIQSAHPQTVNTNPNKKLLNQTDFNKTICRDIVQSYLSFSTVLRLDSSINMANLLNLKYPKTRKQITSIISQNYELQKNKIITLISKIKKNIKVLSVDGCSLRGRRFLNLYVYVGRKSIFLGLIREKCTSTSKNMMELIKTKLQQFGLEVNQMRHLVSDSASNNCSLSKLMKLSHQKCIVHLIHTCTIKYFACKPKLNAMEVHDYDQLTGQESDGNYFQDQVQYQDNSVEQETEQQKIEVSSVINKVRKAIKMIKKSPAISDKFRKIIDNDFLGLSLDCITRWSSTFKMIEGYCSKIQKLTELFKIIDREDLILTSREENLLYGLRQFLEHINHAQLKIQNSNSSIISCQITICGLIKLSRTINQYDSNIFADLLHEHYQRYRNMQTISIGFYLSSQKQFKKMKQLNYFPLKDIEAIENDILKTYENQANQIQADRNLNKNIQKSMLDEIISQHFGKEEGSSLQIQISNYYQKNIQGELLKSVLAQILSIPPNSVENERGFSILNRIFSQHRGSLSDATIERLALLKWRYLCGKETQEEHQMI